MSEQDPVAESTISDETELETLREGIDDPAVLKDQLRKEAEARRHLTARAKTAEAQVKAEREARIKLEAEAQSKNLTSTPVDSGPVTINDEVVDLRLDGYSKSEVEWIMKNGGRKSLEDPTSYTSIAIKARREQLAAEKAASEVADTSGSDIERRFTREQMANMSVDELEKILPHA